MSRIQKPIVVVGSINMDFVVTAPVLPRAGETVMGSQFDTHFGGKGANQAVAVARLGYPVAMIGMVGSDQIGQQLRLGLHDEGVNVAAVEVVDGSSGVASITVSAAGENSIIVVPGANARVSPDYLDRHAETIGNAGMVLAQLEIPAETVLYLAQLCLRYEIPFMLDPAPALELPPAIFSLVDWLTPNETEAAFYTGHGPGEGSRDAVQSTSRLLEKGCRGVVLKRGAEGVCVATSGGSPTLISAPKVQAIDTTAAGDAFNGGFATALMRGRSPLESARFACAVAALSVTRAGAQKSMPSLQEVEAFVQPRG